uniref:Uncharacterized protein n=1 Tax=Pseudo-nitzschia australis TaxID=44445 RepID=A0A7S4EF15_9STRA|mmetsp:Transcript_19725/g.42861  ORF Transcript_19725/g.42861 Transcript_19725/m.42861 type:complete len:157 (+) Transcript_19725:23-493(+)
MRTNAAQRWLIITNSTTKRSYFKGSRLAAQTHFGSLLYTTERNRHVYFYTTTTTTWTREATKSSVEKKIYLHVGPSGDSWIGDAIFAAKHNQPGYVKSIPLINDDLIGNDEGSLLVEILEENPDWAREIYDAECFPVDLEEELKMRLMEVNFLQET